MGKLGQCVRLLQGHRNPLRESDYRNAPCVCGSDFKAKKCCGRPEWHILTDRAYNAVMNAMRGNKTELHAILIEEAAKGVKIPAHVIIEKVEAQHEVS
jgi:hypothetical protein